MSDPGCDDEKPIAFRVVIVGDSAVGKTCVIKQAVDGVFSEASLPTVGQDRFTYKENSLDSPVELNIIDTAGQECFGSLTMQFFNGADAVIVCYSIDDKKSLSSVDKWVDMAINNKYAQDKKPLLYIIENKIDLRNMEDLNKQLLSTNQGIEKAKAFDAKFASVSAKTGENVKQLFYDISKDCLTAPVDNKIQTTQLNPNASENNRKKECC